ncbi:VWA domain-containing protein [Bacillus sp. FJAT-27916]|uniref:VWA domain-containing protein n=1 Tax=Bacillus sp. FJAT-27916 TaxID=1679169 RepID=UPI0009E65A08|nr:VWA domain-containing protein [Bacillus sp. FJAT-27916]
MKRLIGSFMVICCMVLLFGCSGVEKESSEKEKAASSEPQEQKEKKETVPDAPVYNVHDIVSQTGKFPLNDIRSDDQIKEQFDEELKKLPEGMTGKEAYNRVIPLMAYDYREQAKGFEEIDPYIELDSSFDDQIDIPELEEVNVAILLDASGSMRAPVSGGEKMVLAKKAIQQYAEDLPDGSNLMLQVYGHKGTGDDADKELSCTSHEVVYPLQAYDKKKFTAALDQFEPAGWTPIAGALKHAEEKLLKSEGENTRNVIYLVSDGVETCDDNPVAAAKSLKDSEVATEVNIIGFDVDDEGQKQLKEVAEAGGGVYTSVYSEDELNDYLQKEYSRLYMDYVQWSKSSYMDLYSHTTNFAIELPWTTTGLTTEANSENQFLSSVASLLDEERKFANTEERQAFIDLTDRRMEAIQTYYRQESDRKRKIHDEMSDKYEQIIEETEKIVKGKTGK